MHQPTLQSLEFHRVQQELAGHAACKLGVELALAVGPLPSLEQARAIQQETTEARSITETGRTIPFGGIQDIRSAVERAAIGGVLTVEQLNTVADTIYGCRGLQSFLIRYATTAPRLSRYAEHFGQFDPIEAEIHRCIERGGVSSRASRTLKETRNEIATLEGRIQDRLNGILRQARNHLQEAIVTTRNGRYVVPVKAGARAAIPGTVHGASGSGATLFIEPEAIRGLAAELETWRAMEAAEVEQVLATLSGLVAEQADRLIATLSAVAQLDLIFARARLSQAWGATPVRWNQEGQVDLIGARHPLLRQKAVGNRIRLSPDRRMLIVTGPNTGGKTLLLKTLGLMVAIAQSGLHIPAEEGSTLCFFDQLFADIGDQQSLEQSLSTFSGHIANVAPMLAAAGSHTLVLLDELGSGTDPHEGTGLGIAMLEAFLAKGAYVLATTHLRDIKEFGRLNPNCEIAGMGFDGESLQPTYQLIYGTLGESHGLEIAQRAGLPAAVVQRARALLYGNPKVEAGPDAVGTRANALPGSVGTWANALPATVEMAAIPPASVETSAALAAPADPGEDPSALAVRTGNSTAPDGDATSAPDDAVDTSIGTADPAIGTAAPSSGAAGRWVAPPAALVVAHLSPRRCRVWHAGAERDVAIADGLRRQLPDGLLPGDQAILREGQVVGIKPRVNTAAWRNADTMQETAVAANISRLLILISARKPDFHASVLARHLLFAAYHGLEPVICLTKADQVQKGEAERWLQPFRAVGYQAIAINLLSDPGMKAIRPLLGEGLPAIIANPGAGKSTLLARLGVAEPLRDRQSSHQAHALQFPEAGWLVDLPGLRELGMWKPDLEECAARAAAEGSDLAQGRYRQLLKAMGVSKTVCPSAQHGVN